MSSLALPETARLRAARLRIMPIGRQHVAGFHAALDEVARERRYLAMLEAPSLTRTRRFVLDSLKTGAVHRVALDDDRVVGWCDLRPKAAPTQQHSAVLGMGIVAAYRGHGLGNRLLAETLASAEAQGFRRYELIVRADNLPAIALYRRFGFVTEGTCRNYLCVDGHDIDALLMARLAG